MADIVRFGADASDYFNVVDRMRGSLKGLGGDVRNTSSMASGGGDGGGFMGILKGERAVKGQAKFFVTSMLEAKDATDAAGNALQAFISSSKVGLGAAVGAAAIFTAYKIVKEQIEAVEAAKKKLDESLAVPAPIKGRLGPEELGKLFEEQSKNLEDFRAKSQDTKNIWTDILVTGSGGRGIGEAMAAGEARRTQEVAAKEREVAATARQRGAVELEIAEAKERAFNASKVELGTEKEQLDAITKQFEAKKAALELHPDQGTPDRIKALNITEGVEKQKLIDKNAEDEKKRLKESADFEMKNLDDYYDKKGQYEKKFEAALKARAQELAKDAANEAQAARDVLNLKKSPTDPTGLLADVGKIAQDPEAYKKRLMEQVKQEQAGQALIDEAKAEQARQQAGFAPRVDAATSEMYNRILKAVDTQDKATSLEQLSKMDFSAIAKLGDPSLDFSGIEALAGLTIVVQ